MADPMDAMLSKMAEAIDLTAGIMDGLALELDPDYGWTCGFRLRGQSVECVATAATPGAAVVACYAQFIDKFHAKHEVYIDPDYRSPDPMEMANKALRRFGYPS